MLSLLGDFEDDFEFYRHPIGKTGNADYQPNRCFLDAKNISKQIRDSVRDLGLIEEIPGGRHEHSEPDDASHSIERAQMLLGCSEDVQCRNAGRFSSSLGIELVPKPANKLRLVVDNGEHPTKEEQVSRLHCLDVSSKWRRGGWELNTKVLQPAICPAEL
jgi:hypothetical protein